MKKYKKICTHPGWTTMWKKGRDGKIKSTIVKRKGYCKRVEIKKLSYFQPKHPKKNQKKYSNTLENLRILKTNRELKNYPKMKL